MRPDPPTTPGPTPDAPAPPSEAEALTVVPLSEVPVAAVLELLHASLGSAAVERSEAFWRWKHEAGPFGASPGLVALAGGRPVAARVFLPWCWESAGERVAAVRAVDTATHPSWQRRGLFRRLTSELVERTREAGAAFVFNTPNATSRAGYLAMGWHDVGRLPLLVRPLRPVRMVASLLPRRFEASPPAPSVSATEAGGTPVLRPLEELLDDTALPRFLAAWAHRESRLHTPRNPGYLRWRYAEAPGLEYGALWQLRGGSGALAVVRLRRRRGLAEAILVELLMSDGDDGKDAAGSLVARLAAMPGLDYVAAMASPGTAERRFLRGAGFLPVPARRRWTVRRLGALPAALPGTLEAHRTWRVSAGDLELF